MTVTGIITALIVGLIVGALGRLVIEPALVEREANGEPTAQLRAIVGDA